ncbi:MAG: hypothetical protein U1G05_09440 [Kiritimatiellia bacterium]
MARPLAHQELFARGPPGRARRPPRGLPPPHHPQPGHDPFAGRRRERLRQNLPTGEDTDFVFRAFQRGLLVLGLPSLDVVHHGEPATLRQFYRQQLWHANRSSYKKILAETGGKSGGNAPRFAALFLAGLGLALAGGIAAAVKQCPCWLLALLPLAALVFLPALRTALRAKKPLLVFPLGVIYFTYGLARALDLAGFYRNKPSWKAK